MMGEGFGTLSDISGVVFVLIVHNFNDLSRCRMWLMLI